MLAASSSILSRPELLVASFPCVRHVTCCAKKGKGSMTRGTKKENLPSKICVVCNRPFTWRKVWERCWDEVQTCSDRCKGERKRQLNAANRAKRTADEQGATAADDPLPSNVE